MDVKDIILSIDTASFILNASVFANAKIYSKQVETENSNNEELSNLIDALLKEANVRINDVSVIVINQGPGSFTGLRIGYAYITGISSSLNIPIVESSLLKAIAVLDNQNEDCLVCSIAKKDMFFIYDLKEDKLSFESKDFIKNYLSQGNRKIYLFKKESSDVDFDYVPLEIISSKVLLYYYLANKPSSTPLLDLKPNYIQKISAKKLNE